MSRPWSPGVALLFILPVFAAGLGVTESCTPTEQQQVQNLIQPSAACVVDVIEAATGSPDIAGLIAQCGVTAEQVYAIVSELLAKQPEAGVADGALGAAPSKLQQWADAAKAYAGK